MIKSEINWLVVKKNLLFVNKKKQKDLINWRLLARAVPRTVE